jgi:hypothetical protein
MGTGKANVRPLIVTHSSSRAILMVLAPFSIDFGQAEGTPADILLPVKKSRLCAYFFDA